MKKFAIILSAIAFSGNLVSAQEDPNFISKNGHEVLPKAGEFGIGFSATSFLNYAGNLFMGTATAPVVQEPGGFNLEGFTAGNIPATFMARYFLADDMAIRGRLQLNLNRAVDTRVAPLSTLNFDPLAPQFGEDQGNFRSTATMIGAGIEKRRGTSRVQGVFGGELIVGFANSSIIYDYANPMNADFPTPFISDFGTGNTYAATGGTGMRVIEDRFGNRIFGGIRAFAGVEYFFAPKASLGGEFGYTIGTSTRGQRVQTREYFSPAENQIVEVESRIIPSSRISSLGAGFDQLNAGITLNFYF
jgi:hypothetical protein